ncbi:hypothetical protein C1645_738452 [Glomus cerebriforme]|uniref:MIR domain-containing protein n=1 Tax=Glomus cerebriforme TaxID=658196 RepID=A0A397T3M8_9GLOM|nr:hypothetical protein C1645_738452 [Glomus cerebriforme]
MELPKYSGTIHPEWLKQVKIFCYVKQITNEEEILKICKLMIDSAITISNEINSFDELIKALKTHISFDIFIDSCKRKLQAMKYIPEKNENYIVTFLVKFCSLCNYAEINNPEEIKILLVNSYSNDFFKAEFMKRIDNINSKGQTLDINGIVKLFNNVVLDELKIIKYDSLIALKHVTSGRYLSRGDINYQTGSQRKVVFAGEKFYNSSSIWYLTKVKSDHLNKQNMVFYNDKFYLKHKESNELFGISGKYKSPKSGQSEAFCNSEIYVNSACEFVNLNNNNALYVKSKDIVNLKEKQIYGNKYLFLRSHNITFTINDENFQEIIGHSDRIGGNDEWCIELVD